MKPPTSQSLNDQLIDLQEPNQVSVERLTQQLLPRGHTCLTGKPRKTVNSTNTNTTVPQFDVAATIAAHKAALANHPWYIKKYTLHDMNDIFLGGLVLGFLLTMIFTHDWTRKGSYEEPPKKTHTSSL